MKPFNTLTKKSQIRKLQERLENIDDDSIEAQVIRDALGVDTPANYLYDVVQHGCVSGAVNQLIYNENCKEFFFKHYDEILELREDYQFQPPIEEYFLATVYSWFAYEVVASGLYEKLIEEY